MSHAEDRDALIELRKHLREDVENLLGQVMDVEMKLRKLRPIKEPLRTDPNGSSLPDTCPCGMCKAPI